VGQLQPEAKAKIKAVVESLSPEERKLLGEVYRLEQRHLHNKNFVPLADLLKLVKQVIR
jgi:hypothetical protein